MSTYALADGTTNVDTQLAQNAYTIGDSIYAKTLNSSKWNALTPKTALPTNMGDQLTALVYNASLPTTTANGSTVGVNWTAIGADPLGANSLNTTTSEQVIAGAAGETIGTDDPMSFAKWTKKLLNYGLEITRIKSPWLDVNDFRTAAGVVRQTSALMKALKGTVQWAWERRYQSEFEKTAGNLVPCLATGTPILSTVDGDGDNTADDLFFGETLTDGLDLVTSGASNADVTPTANISNAILDKVYTRLQIVTSIDDAWGIDNGSPIYCLVISNDASLAVKRESGIRDDVRKSTMVDSLIKPLGVNESFRGYYHLTQPDMPRFTISAGALTRIEPLDAQGQYVAAYDTAPFEAAYVVHKEVLESQVPASNVSAPGVKFDPVSYMGDWDWVNNKDNTVNILGDKGFYIGSLASAIKPKNYEYGYVILFKRDSTTPAA
jgi:hypothetical protein|tara:strand:+ start:6404 stop:7711 length:1308 start_codon:yes stop_codon:yes gene_type:complete